MIASAGASKSNSRRLAEVAGRAGARAHLLDDAGEVDPAWLAGARHVGVTAGASAPQHLVEELVSCLAGFGPITTTTTTTAVEDVRFALPREPEEMS